MTEVERAESFATSFVMMYKRMQQKGFNSYICDPEFHFADEGFQEMTIQQIRLQGYKVLRKYDDDGLAIMLIEDN
ncbi:hypothetical protein [Paenibacillus xylaniclasticus]|uniref:hypothetical protein n=1 Tax=Paenibacillus xylaniclasticus TaxID=588083 RepID=UPI000FD718DD|nr:MULTISPECIES: hypothetical protein [Paenibacillus]GFN32404.1 hypothetical protein PCURB6_26640 [Paenibacillus curdlanolyticus]